MSDLLRQELAQAGYKECLTFALNSLKDVTESIRKKADDHIIKIANPKTYEFEVARSTLIPGILKTLASNLTNKLPIYLFEISDVIFKDDTENGSRNERHLIALQTHRDSSGLEYIHGLVDYLMLKLNVKNHETEGYCIKQSEDSTFFPERQAYILFRNKPIGIFGIVHPEVLGNFECHFPTSLVEINIEPLIEYFFEGDK
eukprot:TRINITY_DN1109_c0_g1_i2.p1 TRINITY_DN1109_c0_g1~~TRINITY_DN1109_c0_g1_i2.p1  ORF type:complete len:201 (+),score=48.78 TRINITY_DN1109_c0_g1_i2:156-758(+)